MKSYSVLYGTHKTAGGELFIFTYRFAQKAARMPLLLKSAKPWRLISQKMSAFSHVPINRHRVRNR